MVRVLVALPEDLDPHSGLLGRALQELAQVLAGEVLGAGAGQQQAAVLHQVQAQAVHLAVGHESGLEILAPLDQGGRVQADHVETPAFLAHARQGLEGIGLYGAHRVFHAIVCGILGHGLQGRARGVQAEDLGGSGLGRGHAQGSGIGKGVQHPLSGHQREQARPVGAHVEIPAGLLAPGQMHQETRAVLLDLHAFRDLARSHLDLPGQSFQFPGARVVLEQDACGRQFGLEAFQDEPAHPLHARAQQLHRKHVPEAVYHEAGQEVGFAEHQAVERFFKELFPKFRCGSDSAPQKFGIEPVPGIAAHQPSGNERAGVDGGQAQGPPARGLHPGAFPGFKGLERRLGRVHLVAEDPEMAFAQPPVLVLFQHQ